MVMPLKDFVHYEAGALSCQAPVDASVAFWSSRGDGVGLYGSQLHTHTSDLRCQMLPDSDLHTAVKQGLSSRRAMEQADP